MKTEIILIDYENVQNIDLKPLINSNAIVKIFHGESQKFSSEIINLALEFGKERFELIKITGNGKNALDFHIAYYIGKLAKEIKNPSFHIISQDTGFNPLVKHLNDTQNIKCASTKSIPSFSSKKSSETISTIDKAGIVINALTKSKVPKPKRIKTLKNQICNVFKKTITEEESELIVNQLIERKFITIKDDKVNYN